MKKESPSVRFLYGTKPGRCCLKALTHPLVSKAAGAYLSTGLSRPLVSAYVQKNQVDMKDYANVKFQSFNDFFTRKRENAPDLDPAHLISPCDAFLTVHPIGKNRTFHIKHVDYDLERLLEDQALAAQYAGGTCLIFRLTPAHYHRYGFAASGRVCYKRRIEGKLHCVRPIAYTSVPVFVENSREYVVMDTENFGRVVQMEVGALLVGKIRNHILSDPVTQGQEKGYFEFGGSTVILLLEKGRANIDPALLCKPRKEKDVIYGQKIAITTK